MFLPGELLVKSASLDFAGFAALASARRVAAAGRDRPVLRIVGASRCQTSMISAAVDAVGQPSW